MIKFRIPLILGVLLFTVACGEKEKAESKRDNTNETTDDFVAPESISDYFLLMPDSAFHLCTTMGSFSPDERNELLGNGSCEDFVSITSDTINNILIGRGEASDTEFEFVLTKRPNGKTGAFLIQVLARNAQTSYYEYDDSTRNMVNRDDLLPNVILSDFLRDGHYLKHNALFDTDAHIVLYRDKNVFRYGYNFNDVQSLADEQKVQFDYETDMIYEIELGVDSVDFYLKKDNKFKIDDRKRVFVAYHFDPHNASEDFSWFYMDVMDALERFNVEFHQASEIEDMVELGFTPAYLDTMEVEENVTGYVLLIDGEDPTHIDYDMPGGTIHSAADYFQIPKDNLDNRWQ